MILTYAVAQALMRAQEVKSHLPDGSTQPLSEADLQARAQVEKAFPSLKRIRLSLDFDRWKSARTSADPEVMRAEARSAGISPGATEREVNLARSNATVIWSKTKRRLFPSDVLARQQFLQETGEDWPAEDVLDPAPMPRVVMQFLLRLLDTPKVVPPNTLVLASKAWLKGFDHGNNARRRWDTIPRLPAQHSPYATGTKEHGEYQDGYSAGQDAYYS